MIFGGWISMTLGPDKREESNPLSEQQERELLRRCQRGDREALDLLFSRQYPDMRRILLRILGPEQDLEDIIQTALMEVYRSLPRFRGEARLGTWVYRIALNVANQHLRQSMRERNRPQMEAELTISGDRGALWQLLLDEHTQKLWDVVRTMPRKKRDVFLLADVEQLESEQIAEILNCSVSAVYSRLHHARKLFWQKIERQGYFDTEKPGHKRKEEA